MVGVGGGRKTSMGCGRSGWRGRGCNPIMGCGRRERRRGSVRQVLDLKGVGGWKLNMSMECGRSGWKGALVVLTNPLISHERQESVYNKWNISLVICDTDMP